MSGTVKNVNDDALLGHVVTIEHADGVETVYQALTDVQVEVGDKVKQGDKIGNAGRSLLNEEAGIHTHFEIRKDGIPVNPLEYFKKSLSALQEAGSDSKEQDTGKKANDNEEAGETEGKKDAETEDEKKIAMPMNHKMHLMQPCTKWKFPFLI